MDSEPSEEEELLKAWCDDYKVMMAAQPSDMLQTSGNFTIDPSTRYKKRHSMVYPQPGKATSNKC